MLAKHSSRRGGKRGTIIQYLLSDAAQIALWETVKRHLTPGKALYFSHGFGITYNDRTGIVPPADVDVIMVAPKGSGTSLRRMFLEGRGLNSSYAIYQDATGNAFDRVIALGIGVGSGYLFETDFKREVYSDLTGERHVDGCDSRLTAGTIRGAARTAIPFGGVQRDGGAHAVARPLRREWDGLMYANRSTTAQRGALDWMGLFHDLNKPFREIVQGGGHGNEAQRAIDSNSQPLPRSWKRS